MQQKQLITVLKFYKTSLLQKLLQFDLNDQSHPFLLGNVRQLLQEPIQTYHRYHNNSSSSTKSKPVKILQNITEHIFCTLYLQYLPDIMTRHCLTEGESNEITIICRFQPLHISELNTCKQSLRSPFSQSQNRDRLRT